MKIFMIVTDFVTYRLVDFCPKNQWFLSFKEGRSELILDKMKGEGGTVFHVEAKKWQNSVHVVVEWPLLAFIPMVF